MSPHRTSRRFPKTNHAVFLTAAVVTMSVPVVDAAAVVTTTTVTTTQPLTADAAAAGAPDANAQSQQTFLPVVTNLAGTALGSPGTVAGQVVLVVLMSGLVWRRRSRNR